MSDLIFYTVTPSPLGDLTLVSQGDALTGLYLSGASHARVREPAWVREAARFRDVERQLAAYFAGTLERFDLPLAPARTAFQQRVWRALLAIPFGTTLSYGELAARIGSPGAVRAVGAANGRNPISIIVPCHRVIGGDGSLTGYAGGVPRKRWLLALEGAAAVRTTAPASRRADSGVLSSRA